MCLHLYCKTQTLECLTRVIPEILETIHVLLNCGSCLFIRYDLNWMWDYSTPINRWGSDSNACLTLVQVLTVPWSNRYANRSLIYVCSFEYYCQHGIWIQCRTMFSWSILRTPLYHCTRVCRSFILVVLFMPCLVYELSCLWLVLFMNCLVYVGSAVFACIADT